MPVNEQVVDSVTIANVKTIAEVGAHSAALAMQNAVSHQQAMNQIAVAAVGSIVKKLTEVDITEAVSILKATSGNEVASQLAALAAALGANQQNVKSAQTTPPVTGGGIPPA